MNSQKVRIDAAYNLAIEQLTQALSDNDQQELQSIGRSLLQRVFCKKDSWPFRILTGPNADLIKALVKIAAEYGLSKEFGEDYQAEVDPMILQRIST
jgi:hypothetical protein